MVSKTADLHALSEHVRALKGKTLFLRNRMGRNSEGALTVLLTLVEKLLAAKDTKKKKRADAKSSISFFVPPRRESLREHHAYDLAMLPKILTHVTPPSSHRYSTRLPVHISSPRRTVQQVQQDLCN